MWSLLQDREDSKTGIEQIIAQTLSLCLLPSPAFCERPHSSVSRGAFPASAALTAAKIPERYCHQRSPRERYIGSLDLGETHLSQALPATTPSGPVLPRRKDGRVSEKKNPNTRCAGARPFSYMRRD